MSIDNCNESLENYIKNIRKLTTEITKRAKNDTIFQKELDVCTKSDFRIAAKQKWLTTNNLIASHQPTNYWPTRFYLERLGNRNIFILLKKDRAGNVKLYLGLLSTWIGGMKLVFIKTT